MSYYGSIDLTLIGQIIRTQPDLIRKVQMKDGSVHQFVNIDIYDRDQPDQYGNAASVKVSVKREQRIEGVKYYVGNLKRSQYEHAQAQQPAAVPPPAPAPEVPTPPPYNNNEGALPF